MKIKNLAAGVLAILSAVTVAGQTPAGATRNVAPNTAGNKSTANFQPTGQLGQVSGSSNQLAATPARPTNLVTSSTSSQTSQPSARTNKNITASANATNQSGTGAVVATGLSNSVQQTSLPISNNKEITPATNQSLVATNSPISLPKKDTLAEADTLSEPDRALLLQVRQAVLPQIQAGGGVAPIQFQAHEGVVTLIGSVPTEEEKQRIAGLVEQVPGVVQVNDQLVLGPPQPVVGEAHPIITDRQQILAEQPNSGGTVAPPLNRPDNPTILVPTGRATPHHTDIRDEPPPVSRKSGLLPPIFWDYRAP